MPFYDVLNDLECLTLNKNHQSIQVHRSKLELKFGVSCFCTVDSYLCTCNKYINFEEEHVYSNFLDVILVAS